MPRPKSLVSSSETGNTRKGNLENGVEGGIRRASSIVRPGWTGGHKSSQTRTEKEMGLAGRSYSPRSGQGRKSECMG